MSAKDIILNVKIEGANEQIQQLNLLQEEINALALQKKELNAANKELEDSIKKGTITEAEAAKTAKDLAAAQVELNLITKETKKEFSEAEKALLNQGKAMDVAEGSIAFMRLELSKTQKEYINLSKAERDNEKIGGVLQKQIKAQSDELKGLEKEIGITSRSVGDYGQALEGALPLMGGFGSQIQSIIGTLGQMKTVLASLKTAILGNTVATTENTAATTVNTAATTANAAATTTAATATGFLTKALRVLKIAFASIGIGLIVIAVASLISYFTRFQSGIEKVKVAFAGLKAGVDVILDRLGNLGAAVIDFFSGDIVGAMQNAKKSVKGLGDELSNEIKIAQKLEKAKIALEKSENDLILKRAASRSQIKDLNKLAEDITKSDKERADAASKAIGIEQKLVDEQIVNARKKAATLLGLEDLTQKQLADIREKGLKLSSVGLAQSTENDRKEAIEALSKMYELSESSVELQTTLNNKLNQINLARQAREKTASEARKKLAEDEAKKKAEYEVELQKIRETFELNELARLKLSHEAQLKEVRKKYGEGTELEKELLKKQQIEIEKLEMDFLIETEKKKIEFENKRYDNQIKLLEQTRSLEVLSTVETADEKYQKELDFQKKIAELRRKQAVLNSEMELKETERTLKAEFEAKKITQEQLDQELQNAKVLQNEALRTIDLENAIAIATVENERKIEQKEADVELEKEKEEQIKEIRNNAINAVDQVQQIIFANQNRRIDDTLKRELDALTLRKQSGIISEEEYNKERLKLEKEAFDKKKKIDTLQAIINGALAITRIAADVPKSDYGIATGILIGAQVIQTAAQVATIQSQKFAKGGLLVGASHANGGIKTSVGGQSVEFEGGEAIINKVSTAKHFGLLSAINQDGGGVPIPSPSGLRKFQNGGVLGSGSDLRGIKDEITEGVINAIGSIKVVNVASETATVANRVNQIKNISTF